MKGILIMASERSGSNLLRKMLGNHTQVFGPTPAQISPLFSKILPFYKDLSKDENLFELINDICSVLNPGGSHRLQSWENKLNPEEIRKLIYYKNFPEIVLAYYKYLTQKTGKDHFVYKEIDLFENAESFLRTSPDLKIIYLVRDGRDVACSEKAIFHRNRHIYLIAENWAQQQKKGLKFIKTLYQKIKFYY